MLKIQIAEEESLAVEKLFYEKNAYMGLIESIGAKDTLVQKYAEAYVALEKLKKEIDQKYRPKNLNPNSFEFNFEDHTLNYD